MKKNATADLSIHKIIDDYTPRLGQEVTWTITVSNVGASGADNVRVNELLPEGMEFVSGFASAGDFDIAQRLWTIGEVIAGQEVTASIKMIVTDVDDFINNIATVTTDSDDYNGYNNTNTVAVDPWEPTNADLSLDKTVNNPTPVVGDVVAWTVSITNTGPDTAWNTRVTEELPEGLTFVGTRASSGSYDFESGVWNVGHLENGETANLVVSTRVENEAAMQYVNVASAWSSTEDGRCLSQSRCQSQNRYQSLSR